MTDAEKTIADLNKAAAEPITKQLTALPANATLDDEDAVTAARKAYDALSDAQKALVSPTDLKKLTDAEAAIASWKTFESDTAAAKAIKVKVAKVKNVKGKKATVTWKPSAAAKAGATGYQIRYSTSKKFKSNIKTKTVKKATAKKTTVKKLKKGKTYYFQIRTYTKVKNAATGKTSTVYGKWSAAKKVKIKK